MNSLRNASYWVGHFFTVFATIIGVYYASIVSLEVGVKLEMIEADRGTYYVSSSLYKELESNLNRLEYSIESFERKAFTEKQAKRIRFNDFVFQTAKFSESTFEIEPSLLTEISEYYFTVEALIYDYKYNNFNYLLMIRGIKDATVLLQSQKTMIRLSKYNNALKESLEKRDVNLEQPDINI